MYEWPKILTVLEKDYGGFEYYDKDVGDAQEHYEHKLKIDGGWMFFENEEDFHAEELKRLNAQNLRDYMAHRKEIEAANREIERRLKKK